MDSAVVRIPFIGEKMSYPDILEEGGFDIGLVYGAPNSYESRTRFMGAQSDVLHNHRYGNNLPDAVVVPEKEQEAVDDEFLEALEEIGVDVQEPYRELETTSDDVEAMLEVAGDGDTVHGFTSDYHGWKCELTARKVFEMYGNDNISRTFGFETDFFRRELPSRRNFLAQTLDYFQRQKSNAESMDR